MPAIFLIDLPLCLFSALPFCACSFLSSAFSWEMVCYSYWITLYASVSSLDSSLMVEMCLLHFVSICSSL